MEKIFKNIKHTLRDRINCAQYDDEVWDYCRQALDDELSATPAELEIAKRILRKPLDVDAAKALFK